MAATEDDIHAKKICLLGAPKSGKSKLLLAMTSPNAPFEEGYQKTRGIDFGVKESESLTLKIWDVAGSEIISNIKRQYFKGSNAFVVTVDLTQAQEKAFNEPLAWITAVREVCPDTPIILAGTKSDAPNVVLNQGDLERFAGTQGIKSVMVTSAKDPYSVHALTSSVSLLFGDQNRSSPHPERSDIDLQRYKKRFKVDDKLFGKFWSDKQPFFSTLRILKKYYQAHDKENDIYGAFFSTNVLIEVNITKLGEILEEMEGQHEPSNEKLCEFFNRVATLDRDPNSHLDEHLFYIRERLRPHLSHALFSTLVQPAAHNGGSPRP